MNRDQHPSVMANCRHAARCDDQQSCNGRPCEPRRDESDYPRLEVGSTILKHFRNNDNSWGLEWPYIFGQPDATQRWMIWHRHTGEIVHVEPQKFDSVVQEHLCAEKSREINGIVETAAGIAAVNAAHDAEA